MSLISPTLLLIHGFPLDGSMWHSQMKALTGSMSLLAPDLRGFGSNTLPVPGVMAMEDHAADLKELLDARDVDRVVLCGLSMGGYIAMAFLERWPERVAGLVLANTRATADDEAGRTARAQSARDARERGMKVMARGMVPKLLSARTRQARPDLVAFVEATIARQSPEGAAASALGMAQRPDRSAWLGQVHIPTLVITGSEDELMPLPTSQAMADALPGAELLVIPGAGHLTPLEAPAVFNMALERFTHRLTSVIDHAGGSDQLDRSCA